MFSRHRLASVRQLPAEFPAVVILGPRRVGKTMLALELIHHRPSAL
jgi:predicted AAA+ superfamily ATPase